MASIDWEELKKEYLLGEYKSLKEFAEAKEINYGYLRKKAIGWDKEQGTKKEQKKEQPRNNIIQKVPKIEDNKLNDKQKLFCSYYIKYWNKIKAYQKAYQCSYSNAHANSYSLWQNMAVKEEIDRQLKEVRDNIGLEAQDIMQKYIDIAFSDITDFMEFGIKEFDVPDKDTDGIKKVMFNYIDFKNSCDVDGTLISEVKQSKDGVSIKLNDKMKALEWLGKNINMLDTATKLKYELENKKFELEKSKITGDIEETEDDGFIEALEGKAIEVWDDVEED